MQVDSVVYLFLSLNVFIKRHQFRGWNNRGMDMNEGRVIIITILLRFCQLLHHLIMESFAEPFLNHHSLG
jgi:hypothetical protein